ncbi:Cro-like protein [Paracoccus phage vB_PkoS_Pkon1]|nr:Cro-like protein [Paracoccus phage vB_PkoS_Pkon1]
MNVAICDIIDHMSTLRDYIKSQPRKSRKEWADCFGISRPYLYGLMEGTRHPSLDVALRIADITEGAVPVMAWPNLAAVIRAATPTRQPRQPKRKAGVA